MRLSTHVALAFASSALALLIDTPPEATRGSPLNITWKLDPDQVVFYLSNNNAPYWPIGFANINDGSVTAQVPTTYSYQGNHKHVFKKNVLTRECSNTGHIVAFTNDGLGPVGASQEFPVN
ncbi:hypothetical protein VCV18_005126 [Metarhizium anisopliae]